MNNLTHVDSVGKAQMVDVTDKLATERKAIARAFVLLSREAFIAVRNNTIEKGDVLTAARIAGIQGAKRTSELIPLCHNIFIGNIDIKFNLDEIKNSIEIIGTAKTNSVTGIEMEALTAVAISGLTIYDMCKGIDKSIVIKDIELLQKSGGKSGEYYKPDDKYGRNATP